MEEQGPAETRRFGKAMLAGAAGGVAGAWAMNLFSALWEKLWPASAGRPTHSPASAESGHMSGSLRCGASALPPPRLHASRQEWDTTLRAADTLVAKVLPWPVISQRQREELAVTVHYTTGAMLGSAYAALSEYVPQARAGGGAAFGAAVFVLAQQIGAPRLGFSKPLKAYSPIMQANSLGEHIAWGATTELVRRWMRRML